jgi:hypothetical protein
MDLKDLIEESGSSLGWLCINAQDGGYLAAEFMSS